MFKAYFILFLLVLPPVKAINVTMVNPTNHYTAFWQDFNDVANAAAKDLKINLTIIKGQGHQVLQHKIMVKIINAEQKPELIVFFPYRQDAHIIFDLLEKAKIPFITHANKSATKYLNRDKYTFWLMNHSFNPEQGGNILANELIYQAELSKGVKIPLRLLGFIGDRTGESIERYKGMVKRVNKSNNIKIIQNVFANWKREEAKDKFISLFQRHKSIDIVWCASDSMALGVMDAAIELGLEINKDIFIGGFDWIDDALNMIADNKLSTSVGGQSLGAGWLLVKIYDHYNIQDNSINHEVVNELAFEIVNQSNLTAIKHLMNNNQWPNIDFYKFTKMYTDNEYYDFSTKQLIKQLASN